MSSLQMCRPAGWISELTYSGNGDRETQNTQNVSEQITQKTQKTFKLITVLGPLAIKLMERHTETIQHSTQMIKKI